MIAVSSYPQRVVDSNNDKLSRWAAVHHPMKFEIQRQDYPVYCSYNTTTYVLTAVITLGNVIDSFAAGDQIYIEVPNGSAIFTLASYSFPNTFVFEAKPVSFVFNTYGFMNVLTRSNYFIRTQVWKVNAYNVYEYVGTSINKPNGSGRAQVDVSSFLKSAVDYDESFDYGQINKKDLSLGGGYNITYQENWKNYEGSYSGIGDTDLNFFVNAAKQIQDLYGSNMGEYVPFYLDTEPDPDTKAKFLSDFEKPTYFDGYPFSLSFLYSESLAGIVTTREEEQFDVNGVSIATSSDDLINTEVQNVNRLMIAQSYSSNVKEIDVWLASDGTEDCVAVVQEGYVAVGYFADVCGNPSISDNPVNEGALTALATEQTS